MVKNHTFTDPKNSTRLKHKKWEENHTRPHQNGMIQSQLLKENIKRSQRKEDMLYPDENKNENRFFVVVGNNTSGKKVEQQHF